MRASLVLKRLLFRLNWLFADNALLLQATQVVFRLLNLRDEHCRGCFGRFRCVGDFYCKSLLEWWGLPCEKPLRKYREPLLRKLGLSSASGEWPANRSITPPLIAQF